MTLLVLGLVLFLGIHSVSIVAEGWRDGMVQRLGEDKWKGLYSLVALVGLGLIVFGYGAARTTPTLVFAPPAGMSHLTLLLIPMAMLVRRACLPRPSAPTQRRGPVLQRGVGAAARGAGVPRRVRRRPRGDAALAGGRRLHRRLLGAGPRAGG